MPPAHASRRVQALIVGASGQVGHHLTMSAERHELSWRGTCLANQRPGLDVLDIRDARAVAGVVHAARPAYILVPAAFADVDRCELDPRVGYEVNVAGVHNLVEVANCVGATIVCFSSDYIFDGADGPYGEHALPAPISQYGRQKLIGEHLLLLRARDALIVRTTVVYGHEPQGKNFVYRLLAATRAGREVDVPADQTGTPTYAPSLADATLELMLAGVRGVINLAGSELVARDELAREIARTFGADPELVRAVPTAELAQAAPRPLRAGLRTELAAQHLGRALPGYVEGLQRMRADGAGPEGTTVQAARSAGPVRAAR
jgi:dTDP-4-dehydrorhamnose reductase